MKVQNTVLGTELKKRGVLIGRVKRCASDTYSKNPISETVCFGNSLKNHT